MTGVCVEWQCALVENLSFWKQHAGFLGSYLKCGQARETCGLHTISASAESPAGSWNTQSPKFCPRGLWLINEGEAPGHCSSSELQMWFRLQWGLGTLMNSDIHVALRCCWLGSKHLEEESFQSIRLPCLSLCLMNYWQLHPTWNPEWVQSWPFLRSSFWSAKGGSGSKGRRSPTPWSTCIFLHTRGRDILVHLVHSPLGNNILVISWKQVSCILNVLFQHTDNQDILSSWIIFLILVTCTLEMDLGSAGLDISICRL
jgi:hypothetical protein